MMSAMQTRSLPCARARRMLVAYRRDDWAPSEWDALQVHLRGCGPCRQLQESYRLVGSQVRRIETITPPVEFRARVFAAIAAEQQRSLSPAARLAHAETQPAIPVVRARPVPLRQPRRAVMPAGMQVVVGLAAVLVVALVVANLASGSALQSLGGLVNGLFHGVSGGTQP